MWRLAPGLRAAPRQRSGELPEAAGEPGLREQALGRGGRPRGPVRIKPVAVPRLGQPPHGDRRYDLVRRLRRGPGTPRPLPGFDMGRVAEQPDVGARADYVVPP